MTSAIHVLNGPNLNRLGMREPKIYGHTTLAEIETMCHAAARDAEITFRQTNAEFQLIDWIHEACDTAQALVINPAGLTFRSIPVLDALKMFEGPLIELHISNVHARDPIYHTSLVSPIATAVIAGLGANGYRHAVIAAEDMITAA